MPEVFTAAFAQRLNRICRIEVKEAVEGDRVERGRALIAPGNRRLLVRRKRAQLIAEIQDGPLVSRHRPSVDVLFQSVANVEGKSAFGILLTGMGSDGAQGMLEMRNAGAETVAQDEASSVVFGMAKSAIEIGGAGRILSLSDIPSWILSQSGITKHVECSW